MQIPDRFPLATPGDPWNHEVARILIDCAVLSYRDEQEVASEIPDIHEFTWFEAKNKIADTQAFGVATEHELILAFRGTESLTDIISDVSLRRSPLLGFDLKEDDPLTTEQGGVIRAHDGFRRCLDVIWSEDSKWRRRAKERRPVKGPTLQEYLRIHEGKRIWLTGHSLGGAIATLAAARIALSANRPKSEIHGLYTIGSPRALNRKGAVALMDALGASGPGAATTSGSEQRVFRIVKSIDPVPLVPRIRYKHVSGTRVFVTNQGELVVDIKKWKRWAESFLSWARAAEDALGSTLPGQHKGVNAFVADHSSEGYRRAVTEWKKENRHSTLDLVKMTMPLVKMGGAATVPATVLRWIAG